MKVRKTRGLIWNYSDRGNFLGISGNGNSREFLVIPDPHLAFPDRILEILIILSAAVTSFSLSKYFRHRKPNKNHVANCQAFQQNVACIIARIFSGYRSNF